MKRFAKTIVKVLVAYADICKKEFPNFLKDERIVSIRNSKKIPLLSWWRNNEPCSASKTTLALSSYNFVKQNDTSAF